LAGRTARRGCLRDVLGEHIKGAGGNRHLIQQEADGLGLVLIFKPGNDLKDKLAGTKVRRLAGTQPIAPMALELADDPFLNEREASSLRLQAVQGDRLAGVQVDFPMGVEKRPGGFRIGPRICNFSRFNV
jgi:hypothetical protein